jgi:hypothetical protein
MDPAHNGIFLRFKVSEYSLTPRLPVNSPQAVGPILASSGL